MPDILNTYDPRGGGRPYQRTPPRSPLRDQPGNITIRPVFGQKITPPEDADLFEPICPHECRLIEFGGCDGACALMARSDKAEPTWPIPTNLQQTKPI